MTVVPAPGTAAYNDQLAHWGDDQRPQNIAGCAVMIAASTIALVIRMVSQKWCSAGWSSADWLIVAAWVIAVGISSEAIVSYTYGFGLHQLRVILSDSSPPHDLVLAFELFHVHQKWLKMASWIMAAYVVAWAIASTPVLLFQCSPVPYFWERMSLMYGIKTYAASHGHCLPQLAHLAAPSITNNFSDCVILIIPMIVLSRLRIPNRRKIPLIFLFSLGAFVVATGVVRIYYVFHVSNEEDVTCNDVGTVVWTVVECNLGIFCACIPPSMPLFTSGTRRLGLMPHASDRSPARRELSWRSRGEKPGKRALDSTDEMFRDMIAPRSGSYGKGSNESKISDLESARPETACVPDRTVYQVQCVVGES